MVLPGARPDLRVNDDPVKGWNFFLFVNFISNEEKISKNCIFSHWIKGMILFNPFSTGINWKLGTKKERKCNFKQLYLKRFCAFRIKTNIFRKFIQFSSKLGYFLHPRPTCVHGRRFRPLQSPVLLPGACRAQRVNHEAVKDLNFVLFFRFISKWGENF